MTSESTTYANYELSSYNHLGNVRAVVSDVKVPTVTGGAVTDLTADVLSATDYYPFGMQMPGRSFSSNAYRYGFNGMEKDDEVKGSGNSYTSYWRQNDPRLGRWLSLDPMARKLPWQSPYVGFDNNPIALKDPYGNCTNCEEEAKKLNEDTKSGNVFIGEIWEDKNGGVFENVEGIGWVPAGSNDKTKSLDLTIAGFDGSAGAGPAAIGGVMYNTSEVPRKSLWWEGGSTVALYGLGQNNKIGVGADGNVSLGQFHLKGNSTNYSIKSILEEPSESYSGQYISPTFIGGKYTHVTSANFYMNIFSFSVGTPGGEVSSSSSGLSYTKIKVPTLQSVEDSIKRAREILQYYPDNLYYKDFINKKLDENTFKKLNNPSQF